MNNYFRDEYTDFTFNGVRSSQMKVWITNNKDLQFRLTPEFSDTFLTPSFGNTQILNSTNITKSTFSLKCIAINVTMQDWRAIQGWLSPTAVGRLSFDFNVGTYYNAKISKSISGTIFSKGGDRNLSDRYIIEFNVDFTTVGDYAALGEVNVGVLGKNFNATLIPADEENGIPEQKYKIESVSNNRYFIPSVTKINNTITVKTLVKINNKTLRFNHSTDLVVDIIDFSVKTGEDSYSPLYRITGLTERIEEEDRKFIEVLKYQYKEGKQVNSNQLKYETNSEGYFDLGFFGEELFLFVISGRVTWANSDVNQYAICNVGSYDMHPSLLLNAEKFTIKKNGEEVYNYSMKIPAVISVDGQNGFILSQGQPIENVSYKIKQNETIYEHVLVDSWKNNGTLEIESGKPQIFKARLVEKEEIYYYQPNKPSNTSDSFYLYVGESTQITSDRYVVVRIFKDGESVNPSNYFSEGVFYAKDVGNYVVKIHFSYWDSSNNIVEYNVIVKTATDSNWTIKEKIGNTYTFISPEPLQYDHRNKTAVHIFQNIVGMQPYNTSIYPLFISEGIGNNYNIQFVNSNFTTECRLECTKEKDYYKYNILIPDKTNGYNLTNGLTYYISICDYDVLDINTANTFNTNVENFIYLQTRDAF